MLKHILITVVIATVITVSGPRNVNDVARLMVNAAGVLIQLAVRLDPPGYDAGEAEPDGDHDPQQDAGLRASAGSALARTAER